jgi:hypothetical protein
MQTIAKAKIIKQLFEHFFIKIKSLAENINIWLKKFSQKLRKELFLAFLYVEFASTK